MGINQDHVKGMRGERVGIAHRRGEFALGRLATKSHTARPIYVLMALPAHSMACRPFRRFEVARVESPPGESTLSQD